MENKLDKDYQALLSKVLEEGVAREDRTGTGVKSVFGTQIRHNMADGFPLLTTKKMAWKTMLTELKWFLKGDTNIKYLVDNGCNIWNGDAYKDYQRACAYMLEMEEYTQKEYIDRIKEDEDFAKVWGDLGPIYGKQWRNFGGTDQIKELVSNLKENRNSRRHLVNAWNVGELEKMTLPPCHYSFQCYVADNKLSLMWNQRSADLFLGVPFNIASYAVLLQVLCYMTGYQEGELIGNFGDTHLYLNHLEQAKEQISRTPNQLPEAKVLFVNGDVTDFDIKLTNYNPLEAIKAPLSN